MRAVTAPVARSTATTLSSAEAYHSVLPSPLSSMAPGQSGTLEPTHDGSNSRGTCRQRQHTRTDNQRHAAPASASHDCSYSAQIRRHRSGGARLPSRRGPPVRGSSVMLADSYRALNPESGALKLDHRDELRPCLIERPG